MKTKPYHEAMNENEDSNPDVDQLFSALIYYALFGAILGLAVISLVLIALPHVIELSIGID